MANKAKKLTMEWRLAVMMAERRIRTATELHRRLAAIGVKISSAQLTRLINDGPQRLSSELMYGLTEVLDCEASDLWRRPGHGRVGSSNQGHKLPAPRAVERVEESEKSDQTSRKKGRRLPGSGPTLSPYPKPVSEDSSDD